MSKYEEWIDQIIPKQKRLTDAVVTIMENLLRAEGVVFLYVSGRTKSKSSILDKLKRKGYKNPSG